MASRARLLPLASLPLLLAACSDGAPANGAPPDAAPDQSAPIDKPAPADQPAPMDVAPDASPDVAPDAAPDQPAPDTSPDVAPDVTPLDVDDAAPDVAPDVAPPDVDDAAPDAADAPDVVDVPVDLAPPRCAGNADCAGSAGGPVCDVASGACVPCTPSDRGACVAGQYCTAAMRCEAGCAADADCPTGAASRCDASAHRCVGCVTDAHCPLGSLCGAGNACVPGCSETHGCPEGGACCASVCRTTASDLMNCGGCGTVCAAPRGTPACTGGRCAVASCEAGFGDCDATAANGCETDVRTTAAHCGMCGRACAAGDRCVDGACAPPPPTSCAAILRRNPDAVSGRYTITPAGGAAVEVTCDFSTGRGYTFSVGRTVGAEAGMILGGCPAGLAPFQVRSEAHAAALRRFVVSPTPMDRWYWANFFSGPMSSCPTLANRTGWLRTMSEWVDAAVPSAALAPLDIAENCHNVSAFDPVPINDRQGFANRGCSGCRVLYNSTEQDLQGAVVCGVNDVAACAAGLDDCDGDAGNGCETRTATDANNCGACGRRCAAGLVCSSGACAARVPSGFLPPAPPVPTGTPAVMATGVSGPQGLLVAPDGRVYVTATGPGSILRVDPAVTPPSVATFATGLSEPAQLAMAGADAIVVAERSANRVTRIAINADGTAGARTTLASGFSGPWGVTWDAAGNLLVSNEFGNTVDRVAPGGAVTRGVISGYNAPLDMRFDAEGRLWVGQYFGTALNNGTMVHLYDASLTRLRTATGFSGPIGIALDAAGNAYVANWDGGAAGAGRILRVAPDGSVTPFAGGLSGPHSIAFDARGGLWVADYASNRVLRVGGR